MNSLLTSVRSKDQVRDEIKKMMDEFERKNGEVITIDIIKRDIIESFNGSEGESLAASRKRGAIKTNSSTNKKKRKCSNE